MRPSHCPRGCYCNKQEPSTVTDNLHHLNHGRAVGTGKSQHLTDKTSCIWGIFSANMDLTTLIKGFWFSLKGLSKSNRRIPLSFAELEGTGATQLKQSKSYTENPLSIWSWNSLTVQNLTSLNTSVLLVYCSDSKFPSERADGWAAKRKTDCSCDCTNISHAVQFRSGLGHGTESL